jgi:hypothetical protein
VEEHHVSRVVVGNQHREKDQQKKATARHVEVDDTATKRPTMNARSVHRDGMEKKAVGRSARCVQLDIIKTKVDEHHVSRVVVGNRPRRKEPQKKATALHVEVVDTATKRRNTYVRLVHLDIMEKKKVRRRVHCVQ